MAAGDLHVFADGYSFRETLHGPLVEASCDECGAVAYVVGYTGRVNEWGLAEDVPPKPIRCGACLARFYGRD